MPESQEIESFAKWLELIPVEEKIIYNVIAAILLFIGTVLTFKGQKYFAHLFAMLLCIIGVFLPLYIADIHEKFGYFCPNVSL